MKNSVYQNLVRQTGATPEAPPTKSYRKILFGAFSANKNTAPLTDDQRIVQDMLNFGEAPGTLFKKGGLNL